MLGAHRNKTARREKHESGKAVPDGQMGPGGDAVGMANFLASTEADSRRR